MKKDWRADFFFLLTALNHPPTREVFHRPLQAKPQSLSWYVSGLAVALDGLMYIQTHTYDESKQDSIVTPERGSN